MKYTAAFRKMPSPRRLVPVYFAMDAGEDVGEAPAAERPAPLLEVLPQERVQRRTAEQIVDPVPVVPMLFMVEPQMVEQLVDMLSPLDFRIAEQVIDVPKIVCPPRAARTVLRAPQTVEQLVEVPTPVSPILLYFSGLRSSTLTIQLLVVVELVEVFLVLSQDRIQERCFLGTDPLTFVLVEVFKAFNVDRVQQRFWSSSPCPQIQVEVEIFTSVRALQLHPLVVRMRLFQWFFALFPT